jgi:hypothetical protein
MLVSLVKVTALVELTAQMAMPELMGCSLPDSDDGHSR